MKIKFDYNNVNSDDVKTVLDLFYENYKNSIGTDGEKIKFGKLNLYLNLRNETDDAKLGTYDEDGSEIMWEVKNREYTNSKKSIITKIADSKNENDQLVIYKAKSNGRNRYY